MHRIDRSIIIYLFSVRKNVRESKSAIVLHLCRSNFQCKYSIINIKRFYCAHIDETSGPRRFYKDLHFKKKSFRRFFFKFQGIVMIVMMKMYRSEPVMILPKGILWPLDKILSWPSTYEDSISLAMWMGITTLVTSSKTT